MRLSPDLIDRDSVGATLIYTVEVRGHDGLLQEVVRRGAPMPAASGATTLVPGDPVRVAAVQRIFERYAVLGLGLGGIAAALNREGLPSPFAGMPGRRGGGTWSTGTIREVLRNPAYSGADGLFAATNSADAPAPRTSFST